VINNNNSAIPIPRARRNSKVKNIVDKNGGKYTENKNINNNYK
jgi:hypothetical protein